MFVVLHELWFIWCIFNPWTVQDGLTHGRWSMIDFHDGDNFLSDFSTSVRFCLGISPLGIGVLLTIWWTPFIVATWRDRLLLKCLTWEEEIYASWRRALEPR